MEPRVQQGVWLTASSRRECDFYDYSRSSSSTFPSMNSLLTLLQRSCSTANTCIQFFQLSSHWWSMRISSSRRLRLRYWLDCCAVFFLFYTIVFTSDGFIIGSKHWPKQTREELWSWLTPRFNVIFTQAKPDTVSYWTSFLEVYFFAVVSRNVTHWPPQSIPYWTSTHVASSLW